MAAKPLPSPEVLRQLLNYDPETGKLFWKERTVGLFPDERCHLAWNARYARKEAFTAVIGGYKRGRIFHGNYSAHRVIWAMNYGYWPTQQIDHIDLVRTNNRLTNLREVTVNQNRQNRRALSNNKCGLKGVSWDASKNKWRAYIQCDGKPMAIGTFDTKEEAYSAYCIEAERQHGQFARVS